MRTGFNYGEEHLRRWVDALKRSPRILVVYGQSYPASERELAAVNEFARKYNCVILTDFLSNIHSDYCIANSYNMLNAITQKEFNERLSPDILISIPGKRLMNDPITFKIRHGRRDIRNWDVEPDGRFKDYYFRLSSIIEMSKERFFEWFGKEAGASKNNGAYYNAWKEYCDKYSSPEGTAFNSQYVQSRFLPRVPGNSILHLGVGLSFYTTRMYPLNPDVHVFCNMGTNGIDGCTSTFMGQCAVEKDRLCFLIVGDLSFFYDMNSLWNKPLHKNMRILLVNNSGTGLLRGHNLRGISSEHHASAKGWVENCGFTYMTASNPDEFDARLEEFVSDRSESPLFFEVFCR